MTPPFFRAPVIGLAPMEGYSDSPFRQICKQVNPHLLLYTEFTSADGLAYGAKRLQEKMRFQPIERPLLAQIFGKDIQTFVTAAKWCEDMGFSGIDLNMGCPSKKVVRSEHGIALRKNPELAMKIIEAVAQATALPVSVKTRLGWSDANGLVDFGKQAESAGAQLLAIHGRTYTVPYSVPAQFEPIAALKQAVRIPVLANGGIVSIEDGHAKTKGLDGFLIGQAAIGNPWVFGSPVSFRERIPVILNHAQAMVDFYGPHGIVAFRKHLLAYVKGIPCAKHYRSQLCRVGSVADIQAGLNEIANQEVNHELR